MFVDSVAEWQPLESRTPLETLVLLAPSSRAACHFKSELWQLAYFHSRKTHRRDKVTTVEIEQPMSRTT